MKLPFSPRYTRLCALSAGILGFALRIWLLKTGVDEKGLLRTGHPANAGVFILSAVALGLIFLCIRGVKDPIPYRKMFPRSLPAAAGSGILAAGILITNIVELTRQSDMVTILSCLAGVVAAGCLVYLALCNLQNKHPHPALHGCITVYLMIHLICQYRQWSSEPQLQNYFFQLLASVCLMLTAYYRTTLDAGKQDRRLFLFFNYSALFFCCLAAAGDSWLLYLTAGTWAACCNCSQRNIPKGNTMDLPKNVLFCINTLKKAGYDTYVVGGCVRDALLGLTPQDYDLCTAATPEKIAELFAAHTLVRSGEKHGTIGVVLDRQVYEITTFRSEGGYADSRHPDWVKFVPSVEEDLARRDFTINAMAYAPDRGYVDPWGGQADLSRRCLRAVGDPKTRFTEDALRILRGVRFAVRFGFTPDEQTQEAMFALAPNMEHLAKERIFSELCKLIVTVKAADLIRFAPILVQIIPELAATIDFQQHSPHHAYDVYTHTAYTVEAVQPELALRLAALLHDIGKPVCFTRDEAGRGHFYGHNEIGAAMADEILQRLKAPNALRQRVVFLIAHHMTPFDPDKKLLRRRLAKYGEEATKQLLCLQEADFSSKGVDEDEEVYFREVATILEELAAEELCLHTADLAINGNDMLSLGFAPGPLIGSCMNFLLEQVQAETLTNEREALLLAAKKYLHDHKEVSP